MKRKEELTKVSQDQEWDFIIIGGGASGLGSALDATTRGFRTLLLESHDFAKATSSRSTKLVHGGVRYLAQGNIDLVKEALYERGLLAKNAAHLVKNQSFIIPNYNWWGGIYYKIGLSVYDFLAGKLSLGKTRYINKAKTVEKLPTIEQKGLASGVVYQDGQFDDILNMSNPKHGKFVVPSQGIHFVLDKSFLKSNDAIMIPKTSDGRVLFVVPWHERALIGTTDTLVDEPSFEPKALESEIDFVLKTARQYLSKKPTKEDVLSVFAGLRPLAAPKDGGKSTKEVSRSHKVIVAETGLVTITGGKWTTYRQMAEDTIDKAIEVHNLKKVPSKTKDLSIHGNIPAKDVDRSNHLYIYGSDIPAIKALQQEKPEYAERIHPNNEFTVAEVVWAIRNEMAETIEDVLARRVRLLFLDARAAIDSARKVAEIFAQELGWDAEKVENETESFISLAKEYLLVPYNTNEMKNSK